MQRLARTVARLIELAPDREIAVDITTPELQTAFESLASSAGASIVAEIAPCGVVEVAAPPAPLVPENARNLISRVVPGGSVVVIIHHAAGNAAALAHKFGPLFDLDHVHGEAGPEGDHPTVVLRGLRRPQPTRTRIKELRGLAHNLEASILIGRDGLSEGLVASAREALERHGLVKAKLTPRARLDKQDSAVELAWAAGGQLVQRVGKTAVIFRPDVPLQPPTSREVLSGPTSTVPTKVAATPKAPRTNAERSAAKRPAKRPAARRSTHR